MMFGGSKPEEFYYLESEKGRKIYYVLNNDSLVRETKNFPKELLSNIRKRDNKISRAIEKKKLITHRDETLHKISELNNKINELNNKITEDIHPKLDAFSDINHSQILKEYEEHKKRVKDDMFHEFLKEWMNFCHPKSTNTQLEDKNFLASKRIFTKKDLHDWLKINHPDKNPSVPISECQKVMSAAQNCNFVS